VEHESGPELLVYLALGTAGITLAKSVVDLVTTIIKARAEGVRKGDSPREPLEIIVRRTDEGGNFREEIVLRLSYQDRVDRKRIERELLKALGQLVGKK
jgi:hypothetical protein